MIEVILTTIWLMLPASLANTAAAVCIHIKGSGKPIDFGKFMGNNRILGDGKTIEGLIAGIVFGVILGFCFNIFSNKLNLPTFSLIAIFALPVGSLSGDIIASFFKRRLNIKRGSSLPLIDQLDFVFGAWLLTIICDFKWFTENFNISIIVATLIIIPVFHLIFNIVGYKIGVCKEPW